MSKRAPRAPSGLEDSATSPVGNGGGARRQVLPATAAGRSLAAAFARVFERPAFQTCADWAEEHVWMVDGKKKIKWRNASNPYARHIINLIHRPGIKEVAYMKAERVGGTENALTVVKYTIERRPTDILIIYPNANIAGRKNTESIEPSLRAMPSIRRRIGSKSRDTKTMSINFDRCRLTMAGAPPGRKIDANVEAFGYGLVLPDELDRCHPDVPDVVEGRGKTVENGLVWFQGTPSFAGQGIDRRYNGAEDLRPSDRGRFYVPCPHDDCREYHVREFKQVRWPGLDKEGKPSENTRDVNADPEEVKLRAWMKCPSCGKPIGAEWNLWQAQRCELLTAGQRIGKWEKGGPESWVLSPESKDKGASGSVTQDTGRRTQDGFIPGTISGPPATSPRAGVHQGGLYTCFPADVNPYGYVAEGFVKARGRPSQHWVNRVLGEAWKPKGVSVQASELKTLCVPVSAGGYRMGTVPAWVLVLIATIDVQAGSGGYAWVSIYGVGEGGRDKCLVWFARAEWRENEESTAVDTIVDRVFTRADGKRIRVAIEFMDEGDRTEEVVSRARRRHSPTRPSYTVKGRGMGGGAESMQGPHQWSWVDRTPDNKPLLSGPKRLLLHSFLWKRAAHRAMRPPGTGKSDEDELFEQLGEASGMQPIGRFFLPEDAGDVYLRQMTSEHLVAKKMRGSSRITYTFEIRAGGGENAAFDCFYYFIGACDAIPEIRMMRSPAAAGPADGGSQPTESLAVDDDEEGPADSGKARLNRARERARRMRKN